MIALLAISRVTPRSLDRIPVILSYSLRLQIGFNAVEVDRSGRLAAMASAWAMVVVECDPAPDAIPGLQSGF